MMKFACCSKFASSCLQIVLTFWLPYSFWELAHHPCSGNNQLPVRGMIKPTCSTKSAKACSDVI
uniref:Secreted protein n=1 Tax=Lotus japonicus TaxID=34305 RepID=I3T254_LOTJA|nr:unknown [Lotus japonicus]